MRLSLKKIMDHATRGRDFILDVIFPISCLNCGQPDNWLCRECARQLKFIPNQSCLSCNTQTKFGEFCAHCSGTYRLNGVWTAGDYENEIVASLIKNLKYKFIKDISEILGAYTSLFLSNLVKRHALSSQGHSPDRTAKLPDIFLEFKNSLIIPVPLHKNRLKWRGFNQANAIADIIALKLKLGIDDKNLVRVINTRPQAKLGEARRKKNIENSFRWQGQNLKNKNVILFDDVATTGATMNECAKILKAAGAGEVWGLAAAKG